MPRDQFLGVNLFRTEEALQQEHQRALAMAEEEKRKRKEQRLAEFDMDDDYSNDDNMIASDEGPWDRDRDRVKLQSIKMLTPQQQKQSDSIFMDRLMGNGAGASRKSPGAKKLTAQARENKNYRSSKSRTSGGSPFRSFSSSGSSSSSKKFASSPHDRLNNHHHHPNVHKSRVS